jgi:putative endonuclease
MDRTYYVYIVANEANYVLYTGMTNDLKRRIYEHRNGAHDGFTKQYRCHKLVYYEMFAFAPDAISREKQIKAGSREKKKKLINEFNPTWRDLYTDVTTM